MTTTSTCHGGALAPHRPPPPLRCTYPPHPVLRRPYGRRHSWKPMRTTTEVTGKRMPSARANAKATSQWDEEPHEASEYGGQYSLDELDVATFLDPPKPLIPLDPSSFNPASYLWKKIENIPEERRHHLLSLLNPRLVSRAWEVARRRYDNPKLVKKRASRMLSDGNRAVSLELWRCQTSGGELLKMCKNINLIRFAYSNPMSGIMKSVSPLYFSVRDINEVMSTEQPCDLAYEFGDGLLDLPEYPQGFPKPAKHPWPLNDQVVIYIRHVGPGVMVGQAWQEGKELQQVPKKLCNEILMVKDYLVNNKQN
ncbi:Unknown protein [Striga hermonthica]|uniref:Uncharacterized protein n=1 Tax=Striga hermonthica TaxID=68872 RepID=A0A9N7N4B5_STRHE|nr:Unknown protein [Striga hermonthica]